MLKVLIVLAFLALSMTCDARTDSLQIQMEETIEDLLEEPGEETDNSDLYELIEYYINNPVNLNNASLEELSALPYSDLSIANQIIEYRKKYGVIYSKNELYSISAIPQETVQKILPFITVPDTLLNNKLPEKNELSYISLQLRNRILDDLQQRKGFQDHKYEGSPYKIYNRVKANYSENICLGILTDKDAGELSYYDFYSGYINLSGWQGFKNIILGDYLLEFGQGLALWSPYGISKGPDAVYSVKKKSGKLKPYKSSSENNFFRGAGVEYEWEHLCIAGFYSRNLVDANIDTNSGFVTSTPMDGLNRTETELSKRKTLLETAYGVSVDYDIFESLSVGFLNFSSIFNRSFYSSNIYDINGSKFNYYSTYIDLYLTNFNVFGEYSFNGKSLASINGLRFSPSPEFSYTLLLRNYPRNYINLHGFGFGERSGAAKNEFGIYNGFRWRTTLGVLNFYFDQFKFPFATTENPLPSEGNEFLVNFSSRLSKNIEINTRIKHENKEVTVILDRQDQLVKRERQSYRIEFIYSLSDKVRLKTRAEYSKYYIKNIHLSDEGYLVFEDVRIQPSKNLIIYGRAIFFQTDSFNTAIYEYENDLTGILSNIGLYGEGVRFYLVIRYELLMKLSISFKYSETYKPKEKSIGTGYQEIDGNLDNRIGVQLDINF